MNIITISASPYLLTKLGRINSAVLKFLKEQGHTINSCVWHHDASYFLPDENGIHKFSDICNLYPLDHNGPSQDQYVVNFYEALKQIRPSTVISISDYKDVNFIAAIKSLYPKAFKWIAILAIDAIPINENFLEQLNYIDYAIVTNKFAYEDMKSKLNVESDYCPFGIDTKIFKPIEIKKDKFRIISLAKNSQACNIAAFIKSISTVRSTGRNITGYLHTNINDPGDYDIHNLLKRYDENNCIELPNKCISVNEGLTDEELNIEYNKSNIIIDCSVRSATALNIMEAAATGCIPVISNTGSLKEFVSELPEEFRYIVKGEKFIGEREEELQIVSMDDLVDKINNLYDLWFEDKEKYKLLSQRYIDLAKKYDVDIFLNKINKGINKIVSQINFMTVENFV